jgi:hypothetical protein
VCIPSRRCAAGNTNIRVTEEGNDRFVELASGLETETLSLDVSHIFDLFIGFDGAGLAQAV